MNRHKQNKCNTDRGDTRDKSNPGSHEWREHRPRFHCKFLGAVQSVSSAVVGPCLTALYLWAQPESSSDYQAIPLRQQTNPY